MTITFHPHWENLLINKNELLLNNLLQLSKNRLHECNEFQSLVSIATPLRDLSAGPLIICCTRSSHSFLKFLMKTILVALVIKHFKAKKFGCKVRGYENLNVDCFRIVKTIYAAVAVALDDKQFKMAIRSTRQYTDIDETVDALET